MNPVPTPFLFRCRGQTLGGNCSLPKCETEELSKTRMLTHLILTSWVTPSLFFSTAIASISSLEGGSITIAMCPELPLPSQFSFAQAMKSPRLRSQTDSTPIQPSDGLRVLNVAKKSAYSLASG